MWQYFQRGGPVMWPLLALSILGVTVILWRWWALRQAAAEMPKFMDDLRAHLGSGEVGAALDAADRHPGPAAAIVKAGLLRYGRARVELELALQDASAHELALLERGLPTLATIAMIAPLLGFLGTVTGMINSFDALAAVGLNNPAAVARGISQALITTATGLAIAIPVQMAYNYFVARVNTLVRGLESAANLVLEALGESTRDPLGAPPASNQPIASPAGGL